MCLDLVMLYIQRLVNELLKVHLHVDGMRVFIWIFFFKLHAHSVYSCAVRFSSCVIVLVDFVDICFHSPQYPGHPFVSHRRKTIQRPSLWRNSKRLWEPGISHALRNKCHSVRWANYIINYLIGTVSQGIIGCNPNQSTLTMVSS